MFSLYTTWYPYFLLMYAAWCHAMKLSKKKKKKEIKESIHAIDQCIPSVCYYSIHVIDSYYILYILSITDVCNTWHILHIINSCRILRILLQSLYDICFHCILHDIVTPQYVLSTYCMSLRPFHSCLRLLFSIHSVQYTQYTLSVHWHSCS